MAKPVFIFKKKKFLKGFPLNIWKKNLIFLLIWPSFFLIIENFSNYCFQYVLVKLRFSSTKLRKLLLGLTQAHDMPGPWAVLYWEPRRMPTAMGGLKSYRDGALSSIKPIPLRQAAVKSHKNSRSRTMATYFQSSFTCVCPCILYGNIVVVVVVSS